MAPSSRPLAASSQSNIHPTELEPPEPFVNADRASEFLSLRRRRVLELARKGEVPAYPIGEGRRRVWRFRLSELAAAVARNKTFASAPADGEECSRQSPAPRQETS